MCGIAGVFHFQSENLVDEQRLIAIRDVMKNRGPDDQGLWLSGSSKVGLAHRRLSIIDTTSAGHQPLSDNSGRFTVTFNGEIYNYLGLRSALEKKGYQFSTQTDTEVLLHLYAEYGKDMLGHLRGMFAFAIWDDHDKRLFLARDTFGIKPLYYSNIDGQFYFASQVKALLADKLIGQSFDPAAQVGFFLWGSVPEPSTLYADIKALEAGHYLEISSDGMLKEKYCTVTQFIKRVELSTHRAQSSLREILLDTVRFHFIADVPVGIFLSSGVDSSCLLALAREAGIKKIKTITLGFEEYRGTRYDEVPLAEMLAERYQTEHQTIWLNQHDFHHELKNLLSSMDQPTIDGVNMYFVSLAAKKAGLKVALSGLGADEIFAGYNTFKRIPAMLRYCRVLSFIPGLGRLLRYIASPWINKSAGLIEYANNYQRAYLLNRALFMPWQLKKVLAGDLIKLGLKQLNPLVQLKRSIAHVSMAKNKLTALELTHYTRNQLLRDADWAGMAHSVEVRVPYLDLPLFQYCLSHYPKKISKKEIFSVLSDPLPNEVTSRKKTGFFVPIRAWLLGEKNANRAFDLKDWAKYVYRSFVSGV